MERYARYKMNFGGAKSLGDAELLSLIIHSDIETAERVISHAEKHIGDFGGAEVKELEEVYGIGNAKACSIVAAFELGKRIAQSRMYKIGKRIGSSEDVVEILRPELANETREHMVVIGLNSKLQIQWRYTASIGDLVSAPVHPREIYEKAVRRRAAGIIVAHNHPSGDSTPSSEDITVTMRLKEAGDIIGIKLMDHVILGNGNFTSMKAEGYL